MPAGAIPHRDASNTRAEEAEWAGSTARSSRAGPRNRPVTCTFALWALVVSNHRPPPCKGQAWHPVYLVKYGSTQVRATSGFESLLALGVGFNSL